MLLLLVINLVALSLNDVQLLGCRRLLMHFRRLVDAIPSGGSSLPYYNLLWDSVHALPVLLNP